MRRNFSTGCWNRRNERAETVVASAARFGGPCGMVGIGRNTT